MLILELSASSLRTQKRSLPLELWAIARLLMLSG